MAPSLRTLFARLSSVLPHLPSGQTPIATPAVPGAGGRGVGFGFGGVATTPYEPLSAAPSCPIDGPTSCHNGTGPVEDACCFVYPSGRLLLTQFWDDTVHAGGAEEDWTVHGLW